MDGIIQGGSEWVAAAWGISLALLVAYAVVVAILAQRADRAAADEMEER